MGVSGVESGAISSGRDFFEARPWLTRPVKARGRSGSMDLSDGGAAARPREVARRAAAVRDGREPVDDDGENAELVGGVARFSDSRITIPSSDPTARPAPRGRPCGGVPDHRAWDCRSPTGVAGRAPEAYRDGLAESLRPVIGVPMPARGPTEVGFRPGRGGNGWASRFRSEVSAQIARNVSGTMNWSRISSLIFSVSFVVMTRQSRFARGPGFPA
jgi:hypothetical protein